MKTDSTIELEKRMKKIKKVYDSFDKIIEHVPEEYQEKIRDKIIGDEDFQNFLKGIESNRPPRFFLIGRTGAGKNSLINALCDANVASVSDTESDFVTKKGVNTLFIVI